MRAYLIALVCLCTMIGELAAASASLDEWRLYKSKHGKHYEPEEDALRLANFLATKQLIERHNADPEATHKLGLNHMADWTREEHEKLNGGKIHKSHMPVESTHLSARLIELLAGPVPKEVDWRKVPNRVSPVERQGNCGSCWAFGTIGILEGQQAVLNFSELIPLSVQQLIDCAANAHGCNGGDPELVIEDIVQIGGIVSKADYEYEADDNVCRVSDSKFVMSPKRATRLPIGDEDALLKAVANYGPVAVSMGMNTQFGKYVSGVYNVHECSNAFRHVMVVVGYGTDPTEGDYWIVKNSWGPKWGEEGYVRMKRGVNLCGIATYAYLAEF